MKENIKTLFSLIKLNTKVLFSNKFLYFLIGIFLYFGVVCTINYFTDPGDYIKGEHIYIAVLLVPMIILTVFLSALIVPSEIESNTIESLFSVSGSIYKVWIIKIVVMYISLSLLLLILEILSYFMIADFPILKNFVMSLFPLYFIGGMTFFFASKYRSTGVAGIISGIVLLIFMFLAEPLEHSRFFLYLNPMITPRDINNYVWTRTVIENRIGMVIFGSFFYYLGLSRLKFKEKYIE